MEKLKKCPFCGSDAELTEDNYVMCTNLDCGLNSGLCKAFEIEVWNNRLPSHNKDYAKCQHIFRMSARGVVECKKCGRKYLLD